MGILIVEKILAGHFQNFRSRAASYTSTETTARSHRMCIVVIDYSFF